MCQLLRAGPGVRVTRLLVTFLGSQLDKPRLFLVATNRVHVNIAVIINAIVLYILVFMYLLEIKLLLLLQHMGPVHHDVAVYSDSMSCLQAIEGEDTENPFICHIMNLLWSLSDKGTRVRFCWVPSHCGIDGNERVDQLAKETLNQVGCSCTWQRSLSCETNTGATEGVPPPNQSWRGCNHPTSNWPYQGHQIPYLVPRTANWLSPLWWNTDHWPYAAGVCIVTGMSWWILHSRLVECSLRDNSWDLLSRIPARSGILLSDMM